MSTLELIYGIIKLIPLLDNWVRDFIVFYQEKTLDAELTRIKKNLDMLPDIKDKQKFEEVVKEIAKGSF